jgi:uncharacterized membrane protein
MGAAAWASSLCIVAWLFISAFPETPHGETWFDWFPLIPAGLGIILTLLGSLVVLARTASTTVVWSVILWVLVVFPCYVLAPNYGVGREGFPSTLRTFLTMGLAALLSLVPTLVVVHWARRRSVEPRPEIPTAVTAPPRQG